jgi:hypothetical protein
MSIPKCTESQQKQSASHKRKRNLLRKCVNRQRDNSVKEPVLEVQRQLFSHVTIISNRLGKFGVIIIIFKKKQLFTH